MKELIYLVGIAVVANILCIPLKRKLDKLYVWLKKILGSTIAGFMEKIWKSIRHGIIGGILWFLGLLAVLYILSFCVSLVFVESEPTINVPTDDIYVQHGQPGEATIICKDKSFRGFLFENVFPPASLMKLKITPKHGYITIRKTGSSEATGCIILDVDQSELVTIQYYFEEGYERGDVQVSVFGLLCDTEKDIAAQTKVIRFVRATE